ncbi:hypothetical protein FPV67DRAFT_1479923 [Lyophyllum atratum]|nr:hypothetical protein FPV67DRAFT_1479923 [Lyophyllum atratum]
MIISNQGANPISLSWTTVAVLAIMHHSESDPSSCLPQPKTPNNVNPYYCQGVLKSICGLEKCNIHSTTTRFSSTISPPKGAGSKVACFDLHKPIPHRLYHPLKNVLPSRVREHLLPLPATSLPFLSTSEHMSVLRPLSSRDEYTRFRPRLYLHCRGIATKRPHSHAYFSDTSTIWENIRNLPKNVALY